MLAKVAADISQLPTKTVKNRQGKKFKNNLHLVGTILEHGVILLTRIIANKKKMTPPGQEILGQPFDKILTLEIRFIPW